MKIRTKLTIKNICVTASVFLLCMMTIYIACEKTRSRAFFHDLKGEAITKAHLFLQGRVDAETMQSIYLNNKLFINEVEVAVYTTDFKMLYHDAIQNDIIKEDRHMIDQILQQHEIEFYIDDYQCIGTLYNYNGVDYIITAAAYDGYGYSNQQQLRKILLTLFFVGLILLFIVCYLLAKDSLKPIRQITKDAENITSSQIHKRLAVVNPKDELGELSSTFNDLLARLEVSFNSQKHFVSNVSHELRTPLAALIAELDIALQKERTNAQYKQSIENGLNDARRMTKLIDGLINLAKAEYQKEGINMQDIRIDEVLLDVRLAILKAHPNYHVDLIFEQDSDTDENMITVKGNLYLLSIAFSNLIENNCKYSPNHNSSVQISFWGNNSIIRFSDSGMGMTEHDRNNLFNPFFRGEQSSNIEGHGIGMTLVDKIISLHGGNITVHSKQGIGTTFIVELQHI